MKSCVLALVAITCACNRSSDQAPARSPDVVVVAPGAGPQRVLRYQLAKGAHASFELATDSSLTAGDLGGALPTIAYTIDLACDGVLPDGRMKLHATVADVTARDVKDSQIPAAGLQSQLAALKGATVTSLLSPDGHVSDSKVELPGKQLTENQKGQLDALGNSLEQVAVPLPPTPVGAGASWRTSKALTIAGLKLTAVTTVSLAGVQGNVLTFDVATEVHGADQTTMQNGVSVEVKNLTGTGTGHGTIDLSSLATTGTLHSELSSEMTTEGDTTRMKLATTLTTTAKAQGAQSAP